MAATASTCITTPFLTFVSGQGEKIIKTQLHSNNCKNHPPTSPQSGCAHTSTHTHTQIWIGFFVYVCNGQEIITVTVIARSAPAWGSILTKQIFCLSFRCFCNLHGNMCSLDSSHRQVCLCQHNTAGRHCEMCLPLYNDRPWQRGRYTPFDSGSANECKSKTLILFILFKNMHLH